MQKENYMLKLQKKKHKHSSSGMVKSNSVADRVVDIIIGIMLIVVALCCLIPLWHVLMASLSDPKTLLSTKGVIWRPVGDVHLGAYKLLFEDASILRGYANTIIYVIGATAIGMFLNILGGYVLSCDTKLKPVLTLFVMFTMMFNGGLIPTYNVIRQLGFVGTRWSLIIPSCTLAIFTIMMMNAFAGVNKSTVEAAKVDGAGHIRTMLQIMLPQTGGLTVVVVLNSVILQWNSWFNASIYVPNNRDLWPLQLWIRQIVAENEGIFKNANPDYNRYLIQFAVIVVATLPVLIAFPFFQKKLEAGVISGGVKE